MNAEQRSILRKNMVALVEDMEPEPLFPHLLQKKIFLSHTIDGIQAEPTRYKKTVRILMDLTKRGPDAFDTFHQCLVDTRQDHLARLLKPEVDPDSRRQPDSRIVENGSPRVQSHVNGMPATHFPSGVSQNGASSSSLSARVNCPLTEGRLDIKITPADRIRKGDDVYPMYRRQRGLCLIISNKTFHKNTTFRDREGTDVDAENLADLFTQLSFRVTLAKDKTAEQMKLELSNFRRQQEREHQAMVLCILSHGRDGHVFGVDGVAVSLEFITAKFDECAALHGKPKIFILQACRGVKGKEKSRNTDGELAERFQRLDMCDTQRSAELQRLPKRVDSVLAYCTLPGYVSWRNETRGSWFIQALVQEFSENAHKEEVLHLFTNVNSRVARIFRTEDGEKQMPAPVHHLLKKLYFNPGMFISDC